MKGTAAPIPFAGSMLGAYRHVCAFFSSSHEEYDTLLPFVRDGLERGERAYHVFPARHLDEHFKQLRSAGIDVAGAQRRRQLEVASVEEICLPRGHFNKDSMLALIPAVLESGAALGFPLTRMVVHAETVLKDWSRVNEWIEFEMRLNEVLPRYNDPVICAYDANLLNGAIAVDILRTHRVAIIGGLLHENPFFVPPQEFLRKAAQHSGGPPKPYRG
jgi:MEDS: MEthanogen/methylotroph, DcmR Sensory domain